GDTKLERKFYFPSRYGITHTVINGYFLDTVRLVGGSHYDNGRVEVYDSFNKTWENVCYDYFSYNDAQVICRQLELYNGTLWYYI
ncbi:NETR-like protein, partial [Mya arenaria]